jgi:hypothetical protein
MELMRAFNYTAKDLQANRAGRLSDDQLGRLRGSTTAARLPLLVLIVAGSATLLCGAAAYAMFATLNTGAPGWPIVAGLGAFAMMDVIVMGVLAASQRAQAPAPVLQSARGSAEVRPGRHGAGGLAVLRIAGREFPLPPAAASALRSGRDYAVYFVEGYGIVSIEAL